MESGANTYEPEILNRYGLKKNEFEGTDHSHNGTITLKFRGKRIWLIPRIRCSEMGLFPEIQIMFQYDLDHGPFPELKRKES